MREGLDAPTLELPPANVAAIRSFLDGQSRIRLAVWVRHEQHGPDGVMYDHHIVLGLDDEDCATGDLRALDEGIELPALGLDAPTWIDFFPVSEVEELRSFGTVLWEQTAPGADPLDYRYTSEPFVPDEAALARFSSLLAAQPSIRAVGAAVRKLWKGDELLRETVELTVDASFPSDALTIAMDAARASILADCRSTGGTIGKPDESVLYAA